MRNGFIEYINETLSKKILSKWIVLAFDIMVTVFAYVIAYVLRFNFSIDQISLIGFLQDILVTTFFYLFAFLAVKSYEGIIRHSGVADIIRIVQAGLIALAITFAFSLAHNYINRFVPYLPVSIAIIHFVINASILAFSRYGIKALFFQSAKRNLSQTAILIYGAGRSSVNIMLALKEDMLKNYNILGFVANDSEKINKTIEGIKIYPVRRLESLINRYQVTEFIIGDHQIPHEIKNKVVEICLENKVSVKHLPPFEDWVNGKLTSHQLKNLKIEDLLERESIEIDAENISKYVKNKTVLITGAAGSIGSELVRQLLKFSPKKIVLIDKAESGLYDLQMELWLELQLLEEHILECIICDIRQKDRVEGIFQRFLPQLVFHAAAYKHVPLMELNPVEAVHVNVIGTKNIVDYAILYHVEKFIFISTDKAVKPTNVMGATKRCAEMYVQSVALKSKTIFITTRFGNVLGSNGSVIPLFKKQIENGGPITITHPDISRFFMTISEACMLVLQAAALGQGGEIFLFDMGERVKIYELARKMVLLSGLTPGKDIDFLYTGLRPGEKLHEELLNDSENTIPTTHEKIMIAKTTENTIPLMDIYMQDLNSAIILNEHLTVVKLLKKLIPEYISQNSSYSILDEQKAAEKSE